MNTKDETGKEETKTGVLKDGVFSVEEEINGQKPKMTFRLKK